MKRLRLDDKMYILELFLVISICFFTMIEQSAVVSVLFAATFILMVLIVLLQLWLKPKLNNLHIIAFSLLVLSFVHVTMSADALSFDYYKKLIMFACTVLMLPVVESTQVNRKMVNWVLGLNLLLAMLYAIMYFAVGVRGEIADHLTLNFSNPNATGMFLMHSVLYCAISFYYFRHWLPKFLAAILTLVILWLLWQTDARSTLVAMFGFAFFAVINIVLKKEIKISPKISFVLVLLPLLVAAVYLAIAETDFLNRWFGFFISEGKPMTSRVRIWSNVLAWYRNAPIVGAYNGISGGTGVSQLHNTHLDVLTSYGTVPFVLFIMLLHQGIVRILPLAKTSFSRMCMFAFYAVLIQGSFEAALVSGGTGLYILSFGFLLLAKYNPEQVWRPTIRQKTY